MRITKRVTFCAAHHIPDAGKCENNHGHNWECIIEVDSYGDLNYQGFIVDVAKLKMAAFKYDHDDLNKYFLYPSTENVAQKIAEDALEICTAENSMGQYMVHVKLVETENNSADTVASNIVNHLNSFREVGLEGAKQHERIS